MSFKWPLFRRGLLLLLSIGSQVHAQSYLEVLSDAVKQHPTYANYKAMLTSAQSLASIEKARRWPKVDGVLSRVDGKQSLVESQSAWQAGFSVSYPLYESGKQEARARASQGEANQEMAVGLGWMEATAFDLGGHYIKLWESTQTIQEITTASAKLEAFSKSLNDKLNIGEISPLTLAKVARRRIELANRLIEAKGKEATALSAWEYAGQKLPTEWVFPKEEEKPEVYPTANLLKLEADVSKAKADADIAKSEEGLSVQLSATYLERQFEAIAEWRNAQSWQIAATYPIFDGGLSSSNTNRRLLSLNQKIAEFDTQKSQMELERKRIAQEIAQLQQLKEELANLCQIQATLASQTASRFALGRGEAIDVVEADLSWMDCKVQWIKQNADIHYKRHENLKWAGGLAKVIKDATR